jgi:hypothetical protein
VIGAGRSGTTFFFDLLSRHPDYGFLTNYDDLLCRTPLFGWARRLFENGCWQKIGRRRDWSRRSDYSSLWPRKTEAYRFWHRYAGDGFVHGYLWRERPTPQVCEAIRAKIMRLMRLQRRQTFAAKLTGPGRIGYLRTVFPGARFVHLAREARAQVFSTMNVGFWKAGGGAAKLWWSNDLPDAFANFLHRAEDSRDSLALATAQWRSVVYSIRDEASRLLPPEDFREIHYEDLIRDPTRTVVDLWNWLGLAPTPAAVEKLGLLPARGGANSKWASGFNEEQLATIRKWLEEPL